METNLNNLFDSIFPNVDLSKYDINTSEDKSLNLQDENLQQGQDKNKKQTNQSKEDDIKIISRADTSSSSIDLSKYPITTTTHSTPIIPSSSSLNLKIPSPLSSITSKSQSGGKVKAGIGWRINPITKQSQFHTGIDIPATYGTML
jgi:murein DD-endopeptidase MepM/ murein hydrolase activator NlpD